MSWLSDFLAPIGKIFPRIEWSSKRAIRIYRGEVDTFEVCQAHVERQRRPLFFPDKAIMVHLNHEDEITIKNLF